MRGIVLQCREPNGCLCIFVSCRSMCHNHLCRIMQTQPYLVSCWTGKFTSPRSNSGSSGSKVPLADDGFLSAKDLELSLGRGADVQQMIAAADKNGDGKVLAQHGVPWLLDGLYRRPVFRPSGTPWITHCRMSEYSWHCYTVRILLLLKDRGRVPPANGQRHGAEAYLWCAD